MMSPVGGSGDPPLGPAGVAARSGRSAWRGFFLPFSFRQIEEEVERERYCEAVNALFVAGVLAGVLTTLGVYYAPTGEAGGFWTEIQRSFGSVVAALLAWLGGIYWTHHRGTKLRHIEGSISVTAAFGAISFLLYLVVLATGSLSQSAFSATFFVVLTVAFSLPQSAAIRLAFVVILISEAFSLAWTDVGHRQHDLVMVGLSLITNSFLAIVRHMLTTMSGKESSGEHTSGN